MPDVYKVVNATQLDAALTYTADRLRIKLGDNDDIPFDFENGKGFGDAVDDISAGGGITPTGTLRLSIAENGTTTHNVTSYENVEITVNVSGSSTIFRTPNSGRAYEKNEVVNIDPNGTVGATYGRSMIPGVRSYDNAVEMETFELHVPANYGAIPFDNTKNALFNRCSKLRSIVLDTGISSLNGGSIFNACTALTSVQIGGLGKPWTGVAATNQFTTCTALTDITIFVDAATLADISTTITNKAPFGAPNANVIVTYKNSTTGEPIVA